MISEYFKNDEILEAKIDGKFKNNDKIFTDVKELLQLSQYSGAKAPMKEILKLQDYMLGLKNGELVQRPSHIDILLLKDENKEGFDKEIVNSLRNTSREVQLSTSKKVI